MATPNDTLNFGGNQINVAGIEGTIIGVFSPQEQESLETILRLNEELGVEIHGDDQAIILVRKPQ